MNEPAAIYCRVSTSAQATDGTSLQTQLEMCRKYAEQRGYLVVKEVQEDVSGATLRREGLDAIRDLAEKGQLKKAIIYDIDRFARDTADALFVYKELKACGVKLEAARVPIEDTPTGKLMFTLLAAFAEFELTQIRERLRRGRERRIHEGSPMIGPRSTPYGYRYVPDSVAGKRRGHLEIIESEATVVRQIFQWYTRDGLGLQAIKRALIEAAVPTKQGGYWHPSTLSKMLHNELYVGTGHYNKYEAVVPKTRRIGAALATTHRAGRFLQPSDATERKTSHRRRDRSEWLAFSVPPIIERALFDQAQLISVRNKEQSKRNAKTFYLLRGMIRCEQCGWRYTGLTRNFRDSDFRSASPDPSVPSIPSIPSVPIGSVEPIGEKPPYRYSYRYYICPRRRPAFVSHGEQCRSLTYRADLLEERVWAALANYITSRSRMARSPEDPEDDRAERERALLHSHSEALRKVEQEEERIIAAYRVGSLPLDLFQREIGRLNKRRASVLADIEAVNKRLSEVQSGVRRLETMRARRAAVRAGVHTASPQRKREVFEMLEVTLHVDRSQLWLTGLFPHRIIVPWET